jgi:hypothetical protein
VDLRADALKPGRGQPARQVRADAGIGADGGEYHPDRQVDLPHQSGVFRRVHVPGLRTDHVLAHVSVLDQDPAARPDRGDQAVQGALAIRQVSQDVAGVREIERVRLDLVGRDVVGPHLQVEAPVPGHEPGVEIGGQHASGSADPVGQPSRHATRAAPYLQAPPAGADSEVGQVAGRCLVEDRLQRAEPIAFLLPRGVKDVRIHVSSLCENVGPRRAQR